MTVYKLEKRHFNFGWFGKTTINHSKFKDGMIMVKADWCGFCKRAYPEFKKAADITKGGCASFAVIDFDKSPELIEKLGISSFPTFLIVKDGVLNTRPYSGDRKASSFVEKVCKH